MKDDATLWFTSTGDRYFLIPADFVFSSGRLLLIDRRSRREWVDPENVVSMEVPRSQAFRWAKYQLGETLAELRLSIDARLAEVRQQLGGINGPPANKGSKGSLDAAPALLELVRCFPAVVIGSLSSDSKRSQQANATFVRLRERLRNSGIDVDDRFTNFPSRLAQLRADFDVRRRK